MPSSLHQGLVALLSNDPSLAARLLRAGGPRLPAFDAARLSGTDLGSPVAIDRRVDLALELCRRGRRVAASLVEIQLRPDRTKRFTWPHYYAAARDSLRCPVFFLVVAPTRALVRWCRQPIVSDQMTFTPHAAGPDEVPPITDPSIVARHPELGVMSALIHGRGRRGVAVLAAAYAGLEHVDIDRWRIYTTLLRTIRTPETPHPAEAPMDVQAYKDNFKHTDPLILGLIAKHNGDERAGLHAWLHLCREQLQKDIAREREMDRRADAARAEILAETVLAVLADRRLRVSKALRGRILACKDLTRLRRWHQRALHAERAEDLMTRKRLPTAGR